MKSYLPAWVILSGVFQAQVTLGQDEPLFGPPPIEEAEAVATPAAEQAESSEMSSGYGVTNTSLSKPYTPYPAGLSWMPTPQPFRVPIPDRILYYPPHTYVRRCPYYPRGYYWGANWYRRMLGGENLLFGGKFRYNPYWTSAKASHRPKLRGMPYFAPPPGPEGQAMLLGVSAPPPRLHGHGPHLAERPEASKAASKAANSARVATSEKSTEPTKPTKVAKSGKAGAPAKASSRVAKSQTKTTKAVSRSTKSVVARKTKTAQARK